MRFTPWRPVVLRAALVGVGVLAGARPAAAQLPLPADPRSEVFVGSEEEEYLRSLQVGGTVAPYPWAIRGFSPREAARLAPRDSVHPWARRLGIERADTPGLRLGLVRPQVDVIYNSTFPYGSNDGPVWAGRGVTSAVRVGVSARYGPVSLVLAPTAFWSENREFALTPNGLKGERIYADDRAPMYIDLPRRFGDASYARVDPGQSTLRVDLPWLAAGISTANQAWGPGTQNPMVLGNNAPGFLHGFVGTSSPVNVWIGRAHGRVVWGTLSQSEYSPGLPEQLPAGVDAADYPLSPDSAARLPVLLDRRFMSGVVAVFTPRGVPGLEIGGTRFFHIAWPRTGLSLDEFARPVESLLKVYLPNTDEGSSDNKSDRDNQLASVFFRWVLPRSAFEVYGEYAKEDHNWNSRDAILEPDHNAGYMLGFRKLWNRSGAGFSTLRGELINTETSHISHVRSQTEFYRHAQTFQGHTERGQLLGSPSGYGGAGSHLAADLYRPWGRATLSWARSVRKAETETFLKTGVPRPRSRDVVHSLGGEVLLFRGKWEITTGLTGAYNFNRDYLSDVMNLNAVLRARVAF